MLTSSSAVKRSMPTHSSGPTLLPRITQHTEGTEHPTRGVLRKLSEPPMPAQSPPGSPGGTTSPPHSLSSPHMSYKSTIGILRVSGELAARAQATNTTNPTGTTPNTNIINEVEYTKNPNAPVKEGSPGQDHVLVSSRYICHQ